MSSGQRQLMNSLSYIIYHIKNIQSIRNSKDTVAYKHINIVFDEAEMYAHPNFQRDFVYKLLEAIHWCHINTKKIKSIHILLATHSPFVLSDVLSQRSLYLEEGHPVDIIGQSFGGNYYELLENSFFFKESAIGRVSTERIQEWIEEAESEEKEHIDRTPFVGDPIVKRYLQEMKDKKGKWNYVQND
jgi:predicted ATP-binding protein involved in virulence